MHSHRASFQALLKAMYVVLTITQCQQLVDTEFKPNLFMNHKIFVGGERRLFPGLSNWQSSSDVSKRLPFTNCRQRNNEVCRRSGED